MKFKFLFSKLFILMIVSLLAVAIFIYVLLQPFSFVKVTYVQICETNNKNCHKTNLPYQNAALPVDKRVTDLLDRMTIAEKIGQMALIEKNSIYDQNDIAKYGLGALLSGSGGKPLDNTPEGWLRMVNDFQIYSQKTRLKIPILYGVDANHGHGNVPGATVFPHFIGLGASKDPDLVREVAKATAEEVAATGIYWVFSPDLDIVSDIRWGRTYETFSSDPAMVSTLGQAYINGLQSYNENGLTMAATAKHYVGQGAMIWGSSINQNFFIDQGNTKIGEDELRLTHLKPFEQAIKADVKTVLVGLNHWQGEKVAQSRYLLSDVLKKELNFQGFVLSDWYGVYEKELNNYKALVSAINAGIDMVMLPFDYQSFFVYMHRALNNGDIDLARVNDAVQRILKVKFEIGLFDKAAVDSSILKNIGSKPHRELAQKAVRQSLVLLKNKQAVPIAKNTPLILVAGSAADNLGKQCGGWTVEWQGIDGNWIPGTTILAGIRNLAHPNTEVEYEESGNFTGKKGLADIGIAVVGENPYAEGWGDNKDPKLAAADVKAINNLRKISKKLIVILISGRPLNIKEYTKDWDAAIAAWLPGSEGQGVAEVLFGNYNFTGTLPVDWKL